MEYAEKMYLVPHHQLDKLKSENARENIQQTVESDLDAAIRNILRRADLNPYEKVKLYSHTLSRFLTIVKQGDRESGVLTLLILITVIKTNRRLPLTLKTVKPRRLSSPKF